MEFKLSVFTSILVVFSVQVYSSKEFEQIKEDCFKEVGIHDLVTKEKAMAFLNSDYEFSEKHCLQKCFSVASNIVTQDGVLVLSTIEMSIGNNIGNIKDIVKNCQKVAKKQKKEGPCEVFHAGYSCLYKSTINQ